VFLLSLIVMVAFTRLGTKGRLGNQLFQYAFLRFTARRLRVPFYCPPWVGDSVFTLNDREERATTLSPKLKKYVEPSHECGFHDDVLQIADGTDIVGFFQSELYFNDKAAVRQWYTLKPGYSDRVREKYRGVDFEQAVSLSLRFGDYERLRSTYPLYRIEYYCNALQLVQRKTYRLVFSDEPRLAEKVLRHLSGDNVIFIRDNSEIEDLYLLTQCHDNIITNSSFCWWGAWLNPHFDKVVVAPRQWLRSGCRMAISRVAAEGWIEVPGLRPILDHYYSWQVRCYLEREFRKLLRAIRL
jgi:hypothetical protein